MRVLLHYHNNPKEEISEVEKIMAASEVMRYWVIWYPQDEDGDIRVRFIKDTEIREVEMIGEEEQKLASVTPLRPEGSDYNGTIP